MDQYIITIARGFGSGGKTIGFALAKELGIPCYDREILYMASEDSGINASLFALSDEKVTGAFHQLKKGAYKGDLIPPEDKEFTSNQNLFNYQAKILKELAIKESCIVIGRAADYVLADYPNHLSVNVQASTEDCIKVIMERFNLSHKEALTRIKKTDKHRADFYHYYTGKEWNDPLNFDLTLNTSTFTWEQSIALIKYALTTKLNITL